MARPCPPTCSRWIQQDRGRATRCAVAGDPEIHETPRTKTRRDDPRAARPSNRANRRRRVHVPRQIRSGRTPRARRARVAPAASPSRPGRIAEGHALRRGGDPAALRQNPITQPRRNDSRAARPEWTGRTGGRGPTSRSSWPRRRRRPGQGRQPLIRESAPSAFQPARCARKNHWPLSVSYTHLRAHET